MSKLTGVKLKAPHPEDGLLLQYFDGELPKRQARTVQAQRRMRLGRERSRVPQP